MILDTQQMEWGVESVQILIGQSQLRSLGFWNKGMPLVNNSIADEYCIVSGLYLLSTVHAREEYMYVQNFWKCLLQQLNHAKFYSKIIAQIYTLTRNPRDFLFLYILTCCLKYTCCLHTLKLWAIWWALNSVSLWFTFL